MANDGVTPYQSGGAGGKFQKRPIRQSAKGTPYDRPPTAIRNNNNNPSIFSKLANPASRLLYAGADRLFGVFRKRLPSIPAQRLQETIEEPRNGIHEAGPNSGSKNDTEVSEPSTDGEINLASISAATDISEIENVFKQKTFTRSEIERLKALLNSKTTVSDVGEGDKAKFLSTTSHAVRLEASTSGTLNKHEEERENFHAAISSPIINTRVFDEDVASPAELAKAYMLSRPAKVSPLPLRLTSQPPRQDSAVLNNTTTLLRTPIPSPAPRTADSFNGYENRLTTPRSRGRPALYNMAHPPYYRGTSAFSQKGIKSDYGHNVALLSPAWEREGTIGSSKMAGKRSNSELDDIRSGGPVRRIRQKSNLLTQVSKPRSERLLLRNEPEPKGSKAVVENGETSNHNLFYASVPTQSTEMASKIFQQLERMSPKEKPTVSRLAVTTEKLVIKTMSNKVDKNDADVSTSQSNDKVEENGQKMFAVPRNAFSSMNGISTVPAESPQKKRAFHMSANEESVGLDEDNHPNGHVSISLGEIKKPEKAVFANKDVSTDAPAEVSKKFTNSSPSTSYTQSPNSMVDTVELQKEPTVFAKFGTSTKSAEKVSPFMSSANEPFGVKPNVSPNAKPLGSTSLFNAGTKNSQKQFPAFNKVDNGNTRKSVNTFGTSKPLSSASPTTSASGIFSFGCSVKNSSITNGTPALSPFSFGSSAITSSTSAEPKSNNISSSPFASSTLFSSSAAAAAAISATNNHSQGSGTGFKAANTQTPSAVTQSASFSFGLSSTTSNVFGSGFSSASSFGPSSTSGPTASIFGSTQSSAFGSSTPFPFGASFNTSMPSTTASSPIIFGSSQGQSVFGAPPNNNSDQISMETNQTPSPSIQAFAGKPSFEFDSTSPTPSTINPFQFTSQTSQTPSTNPFQAASGSFSLGSGGGGGGDKSGRRIFKAKRRN